MMQDDITGSLLSFIYEGSVARLSFKQRLLLHYSIHLKVRKRESRASLKNIWDVQEAFAHCLWKYRRKIER